MESSSKRKLQSYEDDTPSFTPFLIEIDQEGRYYSLTPLDTIELKELCERVKKLNGEKRDQVVQIIKQREDNLRDCNLEDLLEINFRDLHTKTLRILQSFIMSTLSQGQPAKILKRRRSVGKLSDLTKKVYESDSIPLVLPEEVWCKIFRYLNNKSTKKVISTVCHEWRTIIRSDAVLSGSLSLKVASLPLHDLFRLLTEWPKLHQFEVPFEILEVLSNVDMRGNKMLRKIIVAQPKSGALELQGMPVWARISKFGYDPHRKDSVIAAENTRNLVLELKTSKDTLEYADDRPGHDQERRDLERVYDNKIAKTMHELECLKINYAPYMIKEQVIPFVRELQSAQNLKMLILRFPSTRFYDVER